MIVVWSSDLPSREPAFLRGQDGGVLTRHVFQRRIEIDVQRREPGTRLSGPLHATHGDLQSASCATVTPLLSLLPPVGLYGFIAWTRTLHDSPHSQMAPNICAKRGWAASIWANRLMSGSRR